MTSLRDIAIAVIVAPALLAAVPACADPGEPEVSVSAALVSDYRFRGISLSEGGPAIQGGIEIDRDGWFAGSWGSSVRRNLDAAEVSLYAGRRGETGGYRYSVAAHAYMHTDFPDHAFYEVQALVGRDLGPATIDLELAYAPPQSGVPDTFYIAAGATLPVGRDVSVFARGGYDGGFPGDKVDWQAGAAWTVGRLTFSAALVGAKLGPVPLIPGGPPPLRPDTDLILSVTSIW